ncbi:MAG: hypothetical protein CL521_01435 [Actinobacteria bacterium]|nr:hypothetical protein [Actinomycetota bacterium]
MRYRCLLYLVGLVLIYTSNVYSSEIRVHTNVLASVFHISNIGVEYVNSENVGTEVYMWRSEKFVRDVDVQKVGLMIKKYSDPVNKFRFFYGGGISWMESEDFNEYVFSDNGPVFKSGLGLDSRVGVSYYITNNVFCSITYGLGFQPEVTSMNWVGSGNLMLGFKVGAYHIF